jgi:hypothetical protein
VTTVALAPTSAASFPDGGGHWWVYLQYALGLRDLGCRVLWLERCPPDMNADTVARVHRILARWGFRPDEVLLYTVTESEAGAADSAGSDHEVRLTWLPAPNGTVSTTPGDADVMLNFDYDTPQSVLDQAGRSVLVDIDPGLMQSWWTAGLVTPGRHDLWVTTGETVGTPLALFPDCGVVWHHIKPPVHLPAWPVVDQPDRGLYTTVTTWWGREWLSMADGTVLDNNKRAGFLPYFELPTRVPCRLELAAYFGEPGRGEGRGEGPIPPITPITVGGDGDDVTALLAAGWRLRRSRAVAATPEQYRRYVQTSRGEFSCAKPSCGLFQNAWISDRTLCYLASGRPAVVEYTGPSTLLSVDAGLLRFRSQDEAVDALARVEADYRRHRRAARELVEARFSAHDTLTSLLNLALSSVPGSAVDPARSAPSSRFGSS